MRKSIVAIIMASVMAVSVGCGSSGITQEQYDTVVSERDKAAAERDTYKELYENLLNDKSSLQEEEPASEGQPEVENASSPQEIVDETPSPQEVSEETEAEDDTEAAGDIESQGYAIRSGKYWYYCIVAVNNTGKTANYNANLIIKDQDGNMTGAKTLSQDTVRAGDDVILTTIISDAGDDPAFEYTLSATESKNRSMMDNVEVDYTTTDSKVIITATNKSDADARFLHVDALFYNGDEAVWTDGAYLTDTISALTPGATIVKEIKCRKEFTDVKLFYTSRE